MHNSDDLYSNTTNEGNFIAKGLEDWDTVGTTHSIYGAGLIAFNGTDPTLRWHALRDENKNKTSASSVWATLSTTIPEPLIPNPPMPPKKPISPVKKIENVSYTLTNLNVNVIKQFNGKFIEQSK